MNIKKRSNKFWFNEELEQKKLKFNRTPFRMKKTT